MIPRSTATVGAVLKGNGYSTSWFGKNHNTPDWESSVAGPFDRWPTGMGFDYFYGFIGGETNQYYPVLFENTVAVEPSQSPEEGYHFMADMTDKAINWLRYSKAVAPQKPVFMYFAPGAAHAPHHSPKAWKEKFAGQFDAGWDAIREATYKRQLQMGIIPPDTQLTPRPEWVKPWDSLPADEKKLYAAFMENFAGYLAYADHECGRLLEAMQELPDADNTLIFYIVGDNGASSEGGFSGTTNEVMNLNGVPSKLEDNLKILGDLGGPDTEPHYPLGWAWSGNAPFQWVKQVASHLGGSRNPMVVSWPAKIKNTGGIRDQFTHLIDVVPTILAAAGIPAPTSVDGVEQKPMDGVSIASTFADPKARPVRERQYFEIFTNRAIYDKGWIACAQHTLPWRQDLAPGKWENDKWELYNLDEDFSEAKNLAAQHPDKLAELKKIFDEEAEKNHVYPFDDRGAARIPEPRPSPGGGDPNRRKFTYYAGVSRLPETAAPNTKNCSHRISAVIEMPTTGRRRRDRGGRRQVGGFCALRAGRQARLSLQLVRAGANESRVERAASRWEIDGRGGIRLRRRRPRQGWRSGDRDRRQGGRPRAHRTHSRRAFRHRHLRHRIGHGLAGDRHLQTSVPIHGQDRADRHRTGTAQPKP